jgi:hypothetical protein
MVDIVAALTLLSFEIIYAAARLEPGGQTLTPVEKVSEKLRSVSCYQLMHYGGWNGREMSLSRLYSRSSISC